jgi:hypothetical protein
MYDAFYKGSSQHSKSIPTLRLTDLKTPKKRKMRRLKPLPIEDSRNTAGYLQSLDQWSFMNAN